MERRGTRPPPSRNRPRGTVEQSPVSIRGALVPGAPAGAQVRRCWSPSCARAWCTWWCPEDSPRLGRAGGLVSPAQGGRASCGCRGPKARLLICSG